MMLECSAEKSRSIWVSVAELSGDIHAADLVKTLALRCPALKFRGIAGPSLMAFSENSPVAGSEADNSEDASLPRFTSILGIKELSVMGGTEVLSALPRIFRAWRRVRQDLEESRPVAVILVDAPDFNFKIAKMACKLGIPVYYYISPKIWAWRSGRANFLKKYTRKVLSILPFERDFYKNFGMDVPYVGNPLVAAMNLPELDKLEAVPGRVGLMPGSREKEVKALMPLFSRAAEIIAAQKADVSFHCIQAPGISSEMLAFLWKSEVPLHFESSISRYRFMRSCDCILAASGTATLECALAGRPTVVAYKLSALTGYLARKVINVKYVSLPNLILDKEVFPELLQAEARPDFMANHILRWLCDAEDRERVQVDLAEIRSRLGVKSAPDEAAEIILDDLHAVLAS